MTNRMQKLANTINRLLDIFLIAAAYVISLRFWLIFVKYDLTNPMLTIGNTGAVALAYALLAALTYQIMGLYDSLRARPLGKDILRVLEANALSLVAVAAVLSLFVFRMEDFSRGVLGMFYVLSCILVIGKRVVLRYTLGRVRIMGYNVKHVVVVGDGPLAEQYHRSILANPKFGFVIDGYIGAPGAIPALTCLGALSDMPKLLAGPEIDEVIVALGSTDVTILPQVIQSVEKQGTKICIIPFYNDYIPKSTTIETIGETKLINVRTSPLDDPLRASVKRAFDVFCALLLIVLSSPLMLVAAVGTKLSSPGPIIFRQQRVGLNKKIFTMYKFRSMRINAVQDTAWTKDSDPRKTRFGSFMRKTSIDELPQFFNVLAGDMSLVGPRPELPHFVDQFRETVPLYMIKHRVRPGITGWAQVHGLRGDTSIAERIRHDVWYIENWTFWLDIRILFMTVFGGMVNKEKVGRQNA